MIEASTPERVLAVFAHPDDPEVACGGTLARWATLGSEVHLVIACRGEKGSADPATDPDALAASRAEEVARAADVLGIAGVEHLGHPDGELENDAVLRARLIEIVRRLRPDALVAPDPTAIFFGDSYVNHRDHRQLGWAVLDSIVPAASPLYEPRSGPAHQVGLLLLSGTLEPNAWVDVEAVLATKVTAVSCHETRVGEDPALVAELLEHRAAEEGRRAGLTHAEAFRRLHLWTRRGGYRERIHERPAAVDVLPEGYRALFDRAIAVLGADERVRAVWLAGSLARGTGDAASDLDLLVAVADEHHESFAADWREWLAAITPTVLAEEQWFAKGSFWAITPGYERFDVVLEPASAIPTTFFPTRAIVFDRDDLTAQLPAATPTAPSPATVAKLVQDWFHFSGMAEVLATREDWLLGDEHLHLLRDLLYKVYVEANQPLPPMGLKRWSEKLTPDQRNTLLRLPTSVRDVTELAAAHVALSTAFLETARPLAARLDVPWPVDLEAAATQHVRDILGIPDPYPGG